MSEPQEGVKIQESFEEEEITVEVSGPAVTEVTLTVGITRPEEGDIQPEGPLETRAESLPCAHPTEKQIPHSETL